MPDTEQLFSMDDNLPFNYQRTLSLLARITPSTAISTRVRRDPDGYYYQRGIVDECCKRPCSILTLLDYCNMGN